MVKKGLFQGCFPAHISMERCLQLTADLGFDGLELTMEDAAPLLPEAREETPPLILEIGKSVGMTTERPGAITLSSSTAEIKAAKALAERSGTRIHSIATMMLFFYPLSSPIAKVRDKGIQIVLKMLQAASLLDADTILIVPGLVTSQSGYRDVYRRSQEVLQELAAEAARLQITIAIENVWNHFLLSPLEMARYVDELASSYVGVYFDVANVLTYGYPEDWLRILGPRVKAIHFKDFRKDIDNIRGFVPLLHGDVDWTAVARALREIDYQKYVTVEVPPLPTFPLQALRDARHSLDIILGNRPAFASDSEEKR